MAKTTTISKDKIAKAVANKEPSKKAPPKKKQKEKKIIKSTSRLNKKADIKQRKFEDKPDLENLYMYTVIVDLPIGRTVEKLMQNLGSSMQFTHIGTGTATKEILNILGVKDDTKAIVNAIIGESKLEDVKRELEIFFAASKKNRGVAFAISLTSLSGVRIYKYLTQTI